MQSGQEVKSVKQYFLTSSYLLKESSSKASATSIAEAFLGGLSEEKLAEAFEQIHRIK